MTKPDYDVLMGKKTCPQESQHNDQDAPRPSGFSDWAREKMETERPTQCSGCGLYKVWVQK